MSRTFSPFAWVVRSWHTPSSVRVLGESWVSEIVWTEGSAGARRARPAGGDLHGHPEEEVEHLGGYASSAREAEKTRKAVIADETDHELALGDWVGLVTAKGRFKLLYDVVGEVDEETEAADERGGHARVSGMIVTTQLTCSVFRTGELQAQVAQLARNERLVAVVAEMTKTAAARSCAVKKEMATEGLLPLIARAGPPLTLEAYEAKLSDAISDWSSLGHPFMAVGMLFRLGRQANKKR